MPTCATDPAPSVPSQPAVVAAQPPQEALTPEVLVRRWQLAWAHHDDLLAIARRRVDCAQDAEDVVATAMLRTVESRNLDEARIGRFLCTTVQRLTVDVHRERARQLAVGVRQARRDLPTTPVDETVCDRAEAQWLAARLTDLPEREAQVLQARATGLVGREVATHLGLSTKAAENAYTRLRERAQQLLMSTLALFTVAAGLVRRTGPAGAAPLAVGALGLAVALSLAPPAAAPDQPAPVPPAGAPISTQTHLQPHRDVRGHVPSAAPAVPAGAARRPQAAKAGRRATPRREITVVPPPLAPRLISHGTVYVEDQPEYQDETLLESIERCLGRLDPTDPVADPCA